MRSVGNVSVWRISNGSDPTMFIADLAMARFAFLWCARQLIVIKSMHARPTPLFVFPQVCDSSAPSWPTYERPAVTHGQAWIESISVKWGDDIHHACYRGGPSVKLWIKDHGSHLSGNPKRRTAAGALSQSPE